MDVDLARGARLNTAAERSDKGHKRHLREGHGSNVREVLQSLTRTSSVFTDMPLLIV